MSERFVEGPMLQDIWCLIWELATTLPETNSSHLKMGLPKRKLVFQSSIFRGYVSFRGGRKEKLQGKSVNRSCFLIRWSFSPSRLKKNPQLVNWFPHFPPILPVKIPLKYVEHHGVLGMIPDNPHSCL